MSKKKYQVDVSALFVNIINRPKLDDFVFLFYLTNARQDNILLRVCSASSM